MVATERRFDRSPSSVNPPSACPEVLHVYPPIVDFYSARNAVEQDRKMAEAELEVFKNTILTKVPVDIGQGRTALVSLGRTLDEKFYLPLTIALEGDGFRPRILPRERGGRKLSIIEQAEDILKAAAEEQKLGNSTVFMGHSNGAYAGIEAMVRDPNRFSENIKNAVFLGAHPHARIEPTLALFGQAWELTWEVTQEMQGMTREILRTMLQTYVSSTEMKLSIPSKPQNLFDDLRVIEGIREIREMPELDKVSTTFVLSKNDPIVQIPLNFNPQKNEHTVESSHHGLPYKSYGIIRQGLTPVRTLHHIEAA